MEETTAQATGSELTIFKRNIDLYESIVSSAERRIMARVQPQLDALKNTTTVSVTSSVGPDKDHILPTHSPIIVHRSESNLGTYLFLGVWLGALGYFAFKRGLFKY